MSGSVKGRVLMPRAARPLPHPSPTGVCAWCGDTVYLAPGSARLCLRCGSEEIDARPEPPPRAHQHFADTHTPGSVAFALLGGFVWGSRRG